jgi:hypothetical protein
LQTLFKFPQVKTYQQPHFFNVALRKGAFSIATNSFQLANMEQSRKNKLETERFEIRLWRRHLQHRLTDSTVTEDERLALQFRITDLDEEERSVSDALMAHSFIQAEVDDEEIVNEERNREQQSVNDRREAARLSGSRLGSVPYALAAQVAVPDYG